MYNKPFTTVDQQVFQLKERGLRIVDAELARHYLKNVGYYRLAGYWWSMQSDKMQHVFKEHSYFEDVVSIYNFDGELRILLFDVIEKIEVAFRTRMVYYLSREFDFWWFQNANIFLNTSEFIRTVYGLVETISTSKDIFIKEHKKKYTDDLRLPPAIKAMELITFGALSKLYGNLKPSVASKDLIAESLNTVNHTFLQSWLQAISQVRNICAHHARLWNKNISTIPHLLSKPPAKWIFNIPGDKNKLYIHACCMKYLLNVIYPGHHFAKSLERLFAKYPNIDPSAMGFPRGWLDEPLWVS